MSKNTNVPLCGERIRKRAEQRLNNFINSYLLTEPDEILRKSAYQGYQLITDAIERHYELKGGQS